MDGYEVILSHLELQVGPEICSKIIYIEIEMFH